MTSFRFLHAADIHLDSPLHGLARYEGVPVEEVRGATRAAFDNLIRLAIDEQVDFVVIAGDLFDGTEIDEILTLRIMTLTDEEKRAMRGVDDRARQILERTESLPFEQFMKMHGAVRGLRPVEEDER